MRSTQRARGAHVTCECAWVRRAGFKGVSTLDRRGIVDAVYEAKALAADHTVEETAKAHYGM